MKVTRHKNRKKKLRRFTYLHSATNKICIRFRWPGSARSVVNPSKGSTYSYSWEASLPSINTQDAGAYREAAMFKLVCNGQNLCIRNEMFVGTVDKDWNGKRARANRLRFRYTMKVNGPLCKTIARHDPQSTKKRTVSCAIAMPNDEK